MPPPTSSEQRVESEAHQLAACARRTAATRLHPPEQPIDHLRRALRGAQVAELDPGHLASGLDDVKPHHFAGLEIDQRRIIELGRAADIGRAEADETGPASPITPERDSGRSMRPGPRRAGTTHNRSRSSGRAATASSPSIRVETLAALGRGDNRRDICE